MKSRPTPVQATPAAVSVPGASFSLRSTRVVMAVALTCIGVELAAVLLDYFINFRVGTELGPIRRLFNIAREDSLPSWISSAQTLLVGLTAWFIFGVCRNLNQSRWVLAGWFVVALWFTYMAADDGATVHERIGSAFRTVQENAALQDPSHRTILSYFPSYAWQVIYVPIFAGCGLFTVFFVGRQVDSWGSRLLILSGLGLFALAVGLDFIEGLDETHPWNLYSMIAAKYDMRVYTLTRFRVMPYDWISHVSKVAEEFSEMLGTTLIWMALVRHATRLTPSITLRISR
jgi:hypothetical protein